MRTPGGIALQSQKIVRRLLDQFARLDDEMLEKIVHRGPPRPLIDDRILEAAKVEPLRDPGHRLGMAETDVASRMQGVVEIVDGQEAGGIVEIDQDVAAEDDVELSLRRNGRASTRLADVNFTDSRRSWISLR